MGSKAAALAGVPGPQGVLDHVGDCFGEDGQSSPKCFSLREVL